MKKRSIIITIFIIIFFSLIDNVNALTGTIINTDGGTSPIALRSSAGGDLIEWIPYGSTVTVLDTNSGNTSTCNSSWYKVNYNSKVGYSCGTFIKLNTNPNTGKTTSGDNIYKKENYSEKIGADGTISCLEDTADLYIYSAPGGYFTGKRLSCGDPVTINSTSSSNGKCPYYYNITDRYGNSGYVCGAYVNTTKLSETAINYYKNNSLDDYYSFLRTKGFPESYLPYLAEIHARHPNWVFTPEKINLDFGKIIENESYNGRSLLQRSAPFNDNYLSMDINTYNILNDTFREYSTERGWYNASSEAVAFFMDPRNYLNEKYIFAFESLLYNENHDVKYVREVLNQSYWNELYSDNNVGTDVINASKEANISAMHIASRIRQEIGGISIGDPRLGGNFTYEGNLYSGFYNFYNISVYGENKIVRGMVYAMNNGWNTPYNGILGGAKFLRNGYINVNQDTVYYEKFDVSTSDGNYTHQYQQNLAAAFQETNTTYGKYVSINGYLNSAIEFTIPIYNNMPSFAVTSPSVGNPNNYLKDLKVNNETVSGFSYDAYNYEITIPAGTESIKVDATKINSGAVVTGTGTLIVDSDNKTFDIVVKAESGRTRTYTLKVNRLKAEEKDIIDISTSMNNSGVKYDDNSIFGINEKTDSNSFINNIKSVSKLNTVTIKDRDGKSKSGIFKTGDTVTINNSRESKTYTVVIYGDINGDGAIDKLDYLAVLRDYYGYSKLSGVYKLAADANHDNQIDKLDYLAVLRNFYGYAKINQG